MTDPDWPPIVIAAALIVDSAGRALIVRKRGTATFMQAGGKIEPHEHPADALVRELEEELGWRVDRHTPEYLGRFVAQAANEVNRNVHAEVFYVQIDVPVSAAGEIEEIAWIAPDNDRLPLAPLTRMLLPIARQRLG